MAEGVRACPCCGYFTLHDPEPGSFELCPICFWEDDSVQFEDPNYQGGANLPSLNEAQRSFVQCGACEAAAASSVRKPGPNDHRDPHWQPPPSA